MSLDQLLTGFVYLASVFVLIFIGKLSYGLLNRGVNIKRELVDNDNPALAMALGGYYFGLVLAIGGILAGPAGDLLGDVIAILMYGLLAIVLQSISIVINDKFILHAFNNRKEIIDDRNIGTGIVEAANYVAVGLVLSGALSGEGDIVTALAFWAIGQVALVVGGLVYNWITPFDIHAEIEKDNVAVGVAFAGVLIALGNLMRVATAGDFVSWEENLTSFAGIIGVGYLLLPLLRLFTDKILLPGARLSDELVNQEHPNVGAGTIEAMSYVLASFLISWVF